MATTIEVSEAQARLPELVSLAGQGEEVILTEEGKPVARMVSPEAGLPSRIAGLHPGNFQASEDFDDPLPDEFWTGEE